MASSLKSTNGMKGYIAITSASILWGTMGILAKLAYGLGISPEALIALRLTISFTTLLALLGLFNRKSVKVHKTDILLFLILGVFAVAFQRISYFYAVSLTTATVAAILFYTYPVFVTFYAVLSLKEKITLKMLLAIVLTFLGSALVVRIYDVASLNANFVGIVSGILSSLLFVLFFIMTKRLRNRYTGWTLTLYGDGIGMLALTPIICVSIPNIVEFPLQLWLVIVAIAWVPSLLAYLLYSYGLKYVKASKGSIVGVLEPLSAAIFSATFLGENLEGLQTVGIALALTGVVLLFKSREPLPSDRDKFQSARRLEVYGWENQKGY